MSVQAVERLRVGWFRRVVLRGFLGVLLVGALSSGLVITASPAEALVPPVPLPVLLGASPSAGAAAVGLCGPVCWTVLGAATAGVALYATQDTWMPFLSNLFGGTGSHDVRAGTTKSARCVKVAPVTVDPSAGGVYSVRADFICDPAKDYSTSTSFQVNTVCRVNGTDVPTTGTFSLGVGWLSGTTPNVTPAIQSGQCPSGGRLLYLYTSPFGPNPPVNYVSWGDPAWAKAGVRYRADVDCVKPDGSKTVLTGTPDPDQNAATNGVMVPSCAAAGIGAHASGMRVVPMIGDKALGPIGTVTPLLDPAYPDCAPGAPGVCQWQVSYQGQPCTVGQTECLDWTRRVQTNPTDYECLWGSYTVTTAKCNFLERAYQRTGAPVTEANMDGDPDTKTSTRTTTETGAEPEADPAGSPDPESSPRTSQPTQTQTQTSTQTQTATQSQTATSTATAPVEQPQPPSPRPEDAAENQCWPSGWGIFNPASWVLKPIKCGLEWAFVPTPGVVDVFVGGARSDLDTHGPGPVIVAVGDRIGQLGGSGGGCAGPSIALDLLSVHKVIEPFNACEPPISTAAGYVRAFVSMAVVIGGALAFIRAIAAGFGVSFTFGRGAGDEA